MTVWWSGSSGCLWDIHIRQSGDRPRSDTSLHELVGLDAAIALVDPYGQKLLPATTHSEALKNFFVSKSNEGSLPSGLAQREEKVRSGYRLTPRRRRVLSLSLVRVCLKAWKERSAPQSRPLMRARERMGISHASEEEEDRRTAFHCCSCNECGLFSSSRFSSPFSLSFSGIESNFFPSSVPRLLFSVIAFSFVRLRSGRSMARYKRRAIHYGKRDRTKKHPWHGDRMIGTIYFLCRVTLWRECAYSIPYPIVLRVVDIHVCALFFVI